jgi:hypothetical protein
MRDHHPTEAELERIPVTDEEVRATASRVRRIHHALQDARIPPTLAWATITIAGAAQMFSIMGMGPKFFGALAATCTCAPRAGARPSSADIAVPQDVHAKIKRVFFAVRKAKIEDATDQAAAMLTAAMITLGWLGIPEQLQLELCNACFDDAEQRTALMGQRSQAKA